MQEAYHPAYDRNLSDTWYSEDMNSAGYWLSLLFHESQPVCRLLTV